MGLLSNLKVWPNLLSKDYPADLYKCSAHEIGDVWRRNPILRDTSRLNYRQKKYDERRLFFGDRRVQMDAARRSALVKALADQMEQAIALVEERPDLEDAVELLIAARWANQHGLDDAVAGQAATWELRLGAVLGRDEFGLNPDMLAERLALILGESLPERVTEPSMIREEYPPTSPSHPPSLDSKKQADHPTCNVPIHDNGSSSSNVLTPDLALAQPTEDPIRGTNASSARVDVATAETSVSTEATSKLDSGDADLDRIIKSWPKLPGHVRATIIMLVGAAESSRPDGEG